MKFLARLIIGEALRKEASVPKPMSRACSIIGQLSLPLDTFNAEELAIAAWPQAVGKTIARHTRGIKLVRTKLVVAVEDAIWQKQLFYLSQMVVRNLDKALGCGIVTEVEFRIMPVRREPQRETKLLPLLADEADGIQDPVLRAIYKNSRKRSMG